MDKPSILLAAADIIDENRSAMDNAAAVIVAALLRDLAELIAVKNLQTFCAGKGGGI